MSRDIKWAESKMTDPEETMIMSHDQNEDDLVPSIEEDNTTTSNPEEQIHMHVILGEGEIENKDLKKVIRSYVPQERD